MDEVTVVVSIVPLNMAVITVSIAMPVAPLVGVMDEIAGGVVSRVIEALIAADQFPAPS